MVQFFIPPGQLENERVLLRPLALSDEDELWEVAREESIWQWTTSRITDRNSLTEYIALALSEKETGLAYPFVIVDKASGRVAGSTRYGNITPAHKRLEIGWTWLGSSWQRTGLNRACKYELLRYAFELLGAVRVELKANALNARSREAILKLGAKEEGTLRSHMISPDGSLRNTVYFSMLPAEWAANKERLGRYIAPLALRQG